MSSRWRGVVCAAVVLVGGCGRPAAPGVAPADPAEEPWFTDVTAASGLTFRHDPGPTGKYLLPQIMGSGAALFDADGDGLLDVYLLQNGGPGGMTNRLYRQRPGLRFEDVSPGSGLDVPGSWMGVAVGDADNDGRPDVLLTGVGGVKLFRNLGGRFRDVTAESGLKNPSFAASAAFFDFDRDGWLDLVVVNYCDYDPSWSCTAQDGSPDYCSPNAFPGTVTRLFRNLGRVGPDGDVRFQDVTPTCGLARLPGPGLGVLCADFDGDGWPDMFVANDGQPNRLWINRHDGTFADEAVTRGLAYNAVGSAQAGMGVALADVAGDGFPDVFVTHLTIETHTLWKQQPRGLFRDRTAAAGLLGSGRHGTGFGTVMADFDLDGFPDLAVVNGRVARSSAPPAGAEAAGTFWAPYAERNQLFVNEAGRFRDRSDSTPALCESPNVARGLACGDLENDGGIGLLVTTVGGPARLLKNSARRRGHWLTVRAIDPAHGGRDALGAELTVTAGGRRRWGLVQPAGSYLCSNDPRAHFGLGPATAVDAVDVRWPDGTAERFGPESADRLVVLRKSSGRPLAVAGGGAAK